MRLYELTDQYRLLTERAFAEADADGQLEEDFVAVLSSLTDDIDTKLSQLCRVVRELEQTERAAKEEATTLRDKASRASVAVERIKRYMQDNLESLGERKRKVDDVFTVAIQNNPPGVDVYDLQAVPNEFDVPAVRVVDKSKIRELLKTGQEVPGCILTNGTHLRIR